MTKLKIALALILATASGCASVATGPVVTNISYDASGALSIEKCLIKANFFTATLQTSECASHLVNIGAFTPATKQK